MSSNCLGRTNVPKTLNLCEMKDYGNVLIVHQVTHGIGIHYLRCHDIETNALVFYFMTKKMRSRLINFKLRNLNLEINAVKRYRNLKKIMRLSCLI